MGANKILLVAVLLLSGCTTTPPPVPKPQIVQVPVRVPCDIEEPPLPPLSFQALSQESTLYEKVQALLADRLLHLGYEEQLRTALRGCKK